MKLLSIQKFGAVLLLMVVILFGTLAHANTQSAQAMLEDVTQQMLSRLKAEKTAIQNDSQRLIEIVDQVIMPHVDIEETSKRILAKNWRGMTPAQRQAFEKEFTMQMIRTYATAFRSYSDQQFVFTGTYPNPQDPTRTEVRSLIKAPGTTDTTLNYRLLNNGREWKVYDIIVEGLSIVNSYRSQFNQSIAKDGIDKVIQDMHAKNQEKF